jgi:ATP-dependent Clp protease ATP-binding subunit ClpC
VESEEPQLQEKQGTKGKSKTPALDSFGRDLTELANEGALDRSSAVRMRSNESFRFCAVARRITQCCWVKLASERPRLLKAGADGDCSTVPEILHDRRIVVLDLAMMVAGTNTAGSLKNEIKAVMNEVSSREECHFVY